MTLDGAVRRAELSIAHGMPFNPELGLFGTYGDLRCQAPPDLAEFPACKPAGDWHTLPLEVMGEHLRCYTRTVAAAILSTGARVDVWDIGNEVEYGVAGVSVRPIADDPCSIGAGYHPPDFAPGIADHDVVSVGRLPLADRLPWLRRHLWPHVARLLAAAADGIRDVAPQARFSTHMGLAVPDATFAVAFFEAMAAGGFDVDEPGVSFYPTNLPGTEGRLEDLFATIDAVHGETGAPVFVAEYAAPAEAMTNGPFASGNHALDGYPLRPAGQAGLLEDLVAVGVPIGLGGIRAWAPDLCVGDWAPMAMFALEPSSEQSVGSARPALDAITRGLARAGIGTEAAR